MPYANVRSVGSGRSAGAGLVIVALVVMTIIVVGVPGLSVVVGIVRGVATAGAPSAVSAASIDASSAVLLLRTVRTSLVIGVLATLLAWPAAWALRSRRDVWVGIILVPILMPSYLAYSGWGLLRAPGTWTGDLLAGLHPPVWSTEPGYWPLLVGDLLALAGLSLWAWPLAALVLAHGFSRLDASALEALRLEAGPGWRLRATTLAMARGPAIAAVLAVGLVMLGSAVPLHLAQVRTWAVHIWLLLDQTPPARHWEAWLAAWPLIALALLTVVLAGSRLMESDAAGQAASSQPEPHAAPSRATVALAAAVWVLAVVGPGVLFGMFVPNLRALETFWRVHHGPVGSSVALGTVTAAVGAAIAGAVWLGLSGGRASRRASAMCGAALLVSGLVPGVLVGSAIASAWNSYPPARWVGDSQLIVVLGQIARFGYVPALVGAFLARSEPADERDQRRLDGAGGLRGWLLACLPTGLGTVVAAGLAMGVLAFHEIESAVILQPPGVDSFPRQMLGFLHYARTQELCAGALLTMSVGLVGAGVAVACDAAAGIRWRK